VKRAISRGIGAAGAALALAAGGASAATMSTHLGASLMGMGDHGTANLTVNTGAKRLCWAFSFPISFRISSAAIHTGMNGTQLLELGMRYTAHGCATESAMTLEHLAAKPASYSVWVSTPGHPGDLRGRLHTGMSHM
jgi:hypothetical protein